MEWRVSSLSELDVVVPQVAEALDERRKVALYGDMGVGKTTFVQAFCRWLGTVERPDSPTFSLVNDYAYTDANGRPAWVHHIDLYRIERIEEALDLGIEEMFYDPWYCFVEWPQIVEPILPVTAARLHLRFVGGADERLLVLS